MYYIICKNLIEGFHFWERAPDNLKYLRNEHRHIFDIETKIKVNHDDRDLEINETQNKIENYLVVKYGKPCKFNKMSCEQIAHEIANKFNADTVMVKEDSFGGAIYERNNYEENR